MLHAISETVCSHSKIRDVGLYALTWQDFPNLLTETRPRSPEGRNSSHLVHCLLLGILSAYGKYWVDGSWINEWENIV